MTQLNPPEIGRRVHPLLRLLVVLGLLYLFLIAIQMLGGTFKELGKDQAKELIGSISNPFAALAIGVLATVIVQSSSVTTATIVGIVTSAVVQRGSSDPEVLKEVVGTFVPMIMGANIGTTITNTLVSLGHVTRSSEFERAFTGATIHDFFNLMTVAMLLPIEIATGFLTKSAIWLVTSLNLGEGLEYKSVVKTAVKWAYKQIKAVVGDGIGLEGIPFAVVMVILAIALIFTCLVYITANMRVLMATRLERAINSALEKSGILGMVIGVVVTVAVQSSSITTSILVPMFGAGLLSHANGFPIMLGANVGTTVTALLAAIAGGPAGLAIAFVHLLFNLLGILLIYPIPAVREIPIRLAQGLARRVMGNRWWILGYVGGAFVVLPLVCILLFD